MSQVMEFPTTKISAEPEKANYQNYLAWQQAHAQRRRESCTQFNMFQYKAAKRMSKQVSYKENANEKSEQLKDQVERRLSTACDCEDCFKQEKGRRNSDASITPSSPTSSVRGSFSSLGTSSSMSPPRTAVKGPASQSSRNSLIISPPPRSRHHKRRTNSPSST